MIQYIYIKVFNLTHNHFLAYFASFSFRILNTFAFFIKKLFRKKQIARMNVAEADSIIHSVHANSCNAIEIKNKTVDNSIDLSIIVTVYNYERGLIKNILSCINQKTAYNYEVIFVNDGSTDNSLNILCQYEDNPLIKIINKENGGAGAARNAGIDIAVGKYLSFVDCDDILHLDFVEKMIETAYKNHCDIVMCGHNCIKTKNNEEISVEPYIYPPKNMLSYKYNDLKMNYPGFPWGKIYKREIWRNVRFPSGCWYEDTIIQMLVFLQSNSFMYLSEPLYDYFIHENNITLKVSGTANVKAIDRYWVMNYICENIDKMDCFSDFQVYELLLKHFSLYYYKDIKKLDSKVIEALFVLAKSLAFKYKPSQKVKLTYMLKQVEHAFLTDDIELWRIASSFQ